MFNNRRGIPVTLRCNSVRCNKSNELPCLHADPTHATSLCDVRTPDMSKTKFKIMLIWMGYTNCPGIHNEKKYIHNIDNDVILLTDINFI